MINIFICSTNIVHNILKLNNYIVSMQKYFVWISFLIRCKHFLFLTIVLVSNNYDLNYLPMRKNCAAPVQSAAHAYANEY